MATDQRKPRNQKATEVSRRLRHDGTVPERLPWGVLRGGRLGGHKFRRQHPIGPYVTDFCGMEVKLVVERDGMTHVGTGERDDGRTRCLEQEGFRVVRVTDDDVLENLEAVATMILRECAPLNRPLIPSPQPSPGGRGGRP